MRSDSSAKSGNSLSTLVTQWRGGFLALLVSLVSGLAMLAVSPVNGAPASVEKSTIPGGGLEAHEKAGGHMLSRHVGKSAEELRRRLDTDSRISAASSFTDRKSADAAVAATLKANQKRIDSWLKKDEDRLVVSHHNSSPVGISVSRNGSTPRNASGTRLVLVRDGKFPGGWRILTGYPEL